MADDVQPLSDEERAELEALRAEKARREADEQARREREELETLRRQRRAAERASAQARSESEQDARIAEARARGAKMMEPDDDLNMPMGQKIVLGVLLLLAAIIVFMTFVTR